MKLRAKNKTETVGLVACWHKGSNWNSRGKGGFCTVPGVGISNIHSHCLGGFLSECDMAGCRAPCPHSTGHTTQAQLTSQMLQPVSASGPTEAKTRPWFLTVSWCTTLLLTSWPPNFGPLSWFLFLWLKIFISMAILLLANSSFYQLLAF